MDEQVTPSQAEGERDDEDATTDGRPDIFEIHTWGKRGARDDLPVQTLDPLGNLVLLLRGDLLRRYPNTMVIAVRAVRVNGVQKPSDVAADLRYWTIRADVGLLDVAWATKEAELELARDLERTRDRSVKNIDRAVTEALEDSE